MKTSTFVEELRHEEIVAAIAEAERRTSGEIRVFISREAVADPVSMAMEQFIRLGMEKTQDRNGVLIFIAPRSRNFAVLGDVNVHARCGDKFWQEMAEELSSHFKEHHFNRGLLSAIKKAEDLLAEAFPRRPDDRNELPDRVEGD